VSDFTLPENKEGTKSTTINQYAIVTFEEVMLWQN
jgi:hypothetical protein